MARLDIMPLSGEIVLEDQHGRLLYKTLDNAPYYATGNGRTEIREYNGRLVEVWHFKKWKETWRTSEI